MCCRVKHLKTTKPCLGERVAPPLVLGLALLWLCCVVVAGLDFPGPPSAGPSLHWTPLCRTAQNFALFLPFPATVSLFLCLSGCLLVEFWWCFEGRNPEMCTFGVLGLSCASPGGPVWWGRRGFTTARELQTCTFQGSILQNTTKIPRENPQRDTETAKWWREREEKARNFGPPTLRGPTLGPHPFGAPPFRGPTLWGTTLRGAHPSGPHFFYFWAPPIGAPPLGAPPSGPHPFGAPPFRGPTLSGPHPFGAPPFRAPPFRGPTLRGGAHFSRFGPPTLLGPTLLGPTLLGPTLLEPRWVKH